MSGTDDHKKTEKKMNPVLEEILSWVKVLAVSVLIALICNNFIIANSTVPTGSMENTIMGGDRVIGLRLSYTFGEPARGDIAIFDFGWICENCRSAMGEGEAPEVCPRCSKTINKPKTLHYLKRTIGLPGDHIEIVREGTVVQSELQDISGLDPSRQNEELITAAIYVNGERLEEPYLKEPMLYSGDMVFDVPEGCYFFMGDNRNNSLDSRYWNNSYIERDRIIAKVLFRYWKTPKLLH